MEATEIILEVLDSFQYGAILLNRDLNIVHMNEYALNIFEYKKEEVENQSVNILVPPELREKHKQYMFNSDYSTMREHIIGKDRNINAVTKYGKIILIKLRFNPLEFRNVNYNIINFDLVKKDTIETLEELGNVGTWEWDVEKGIIDWSPQLRKIYKLPQDYKITFENAMDMIEDEDRKFINELANNLIKNKIAYTVTYRAKNFIGERLFIYSSADPVIINGKVIKMCGFSQDITRYKTLEEKIAITQDSLNNLSHEIKAPLKSLIGICDILKESDKNDKDIECIQVISETISYLLKVSKNILDMTKVENNQLQVVMDNICLRKYVKDVMRPFILKKHDNIEISAHVEEDVPETINTDPILLFQIINNLVSNALNSTKKGFIKVFVSFDPETKKVIFKVEDTGIGIHADRQKAIFEEYASYTKGGTGLGLFICKKILRSLKGRLTVESAVDKGSIFTFEIPTNELN